MAAYSHSNNLGLDGEDAFEVSPARGVGLSSKPSTSAVVAAVAPHSAGTATATDDLAGIAFVHTNKSMKVASVPNEYLFRKPAGTSSSLTASFANSNSSAPNSDVGADRSTDCNPDKLAPWLVGLPSTKLNLSTASAGNANAPVIDLMGDDDEDIESRGVHAAAGDADAGIGSGTDGDDSASELGNTAKRRRLDNLPPLPASDSEAEDSVSDVDEAQVLRATAAGAGAAADPRLTITASSSRAGHAQQRAESDDDDDVDDDDDDEDRTPVVDITEPGSLQLHLNSNEAAGGKLTIDDLVGGGSDTMANNAAAAAKPSSKSVAANAALLAASAASASSAAASNAAASKGPDDMIKSGVQMALLTSQIKKSQGSGRYFAGKHAGAADAHFRCFRCKQTGHFAMNCPNEPARAEACFVCADPEHEANECPDSEVCFVCDDNGHRWAQCPNRRILDDDLEKHGRPKGYGRTFVSQIGPAEAAARLLPRSWYSNARGAAFVKHAKSMPKFDVLTLHYCSVCGSDGHQTGRCPHAGEASMAQCCVCGQIGHAFCIRPEPTASSTAAAAAAGGHSGRRQHRSVLELGSDDSDADDNSEVGDDDAVNPLAQTYGLGLSKIPLNGRVENPEIQAEVDAARNASDAATGTCFNCGSDAHWGDRCPKPRSNDLRVGPGSNMGGDAISEVLRTSEEATARRDQYVSGLANRGRWDDDGNGGRRTVTYPRDEGRGTGNGTFDRSERDRYQQQQQYRSSAGDDDRTAGRKRGRNDDGDDRIALTRGGGGSCDPYRSRREVHGGRRVVDRDSDGYTYSDVELGSEDDDDDDDGDSRDDRRERGRLAERGHQDRDRERSRAASSGPPASSSSSRMADIQCRKCGNYGHIARNCDPSEYTSSHHGSAAAGGDARSAINSSITCFRCGLPGHIARDCNGAGASGFASDPRDRGRQVQAPPHLQSQQHRQQQYQPYQQQQPQYAGRGDADRFGDRDHRDGRRDGSRGPPIQYAAPAVAHADWRSQAASDREARSSRVDDRVVTDVRNARLQITSSNGGGPSSNGPIRQVAQPGTAGGGQQQPAGHFVKLQSSAPAAAAFNQPFKSSLPSVAQRQQQQQQPAAASKPAPPRPAPAPAAAARPAAGAGGGGDDDDDVKAPWYERDAGAAAERRKVLARTDIDDAVKNDMLQKLRKKVKRNEKKGR